MTAPESLRSCSEAVERACSELLEPTPAALDRCSAVLDGVVQGMSALRPRLEAAHGDAEALAEAWRLGRNVRRAAALLENAASYHAGWNQRLSVQTAGYGPGGEPGAITRPGQISVRG